MKLTIAGKPKIEEAAAFDLIHDGDDVVLISKWADEYKDETPLSQCELLRFHPDGTCTAALRRGVFHKRDSLDRLIIKHSTK